MSLSFVTFDDALIERVFQPVSDALSDRLGMDRRQVACFCIDLASLAWILSQARALSDAVLGWEAGSAFLRLALFLLGLMALTGLRGLFRRMSAVMQANPLRLKMRPHRAVILLMLIARMADMGGMAVPDMADLAMLGFATIALYLGACTSRPPVRRWMSTLEQAV